MDKSALITLLANAAVTILTTVIVTRITLGKPAFVSGSSIKSALRRYGSLLFAAFGLLINTYAVIRFMTNGLAIRKFDVLFIPINTAGAIMFAVSIVGLLAVCRARA
jgi:hypothetical protein